MGTKRALASVVCGLIAGLDRPGHVADLFSGMGSVAAALAPTQPVLTNDALTFTTAFARSRFTPQRRSSGQAVLRELWPHVQIATKSLRRRYEPLCREEDSAVAAGPDAWKAFMLERTASTTTLPARGVLADHQPASYKLATTYFSAGYFGTRQAMDLDAIRFAIDATDLEVSRDWLLSAWLSAAAAVINTPGHTAQFLKPTTPEVTKRIERQRCRSVWREFAVRLDAIQPVGDSAWRRANRVTAEDALDVISQPVFGAVGVVYADPPYTKDQYSRYYHVYETLYRYDYPGARGAGRSRPNGFRTGFSLESEVESTFKAMAKRIADRELPLVLSYPADGLLASRNVDIKDLLQTEFRIVETVELVMDHSTFGGSTGSRSKKAVERIYVASN